MPSETLRENQFLAFSSLQRWPTCHSSQPLPPALEPATSDPVLLLCSLWFWLLISNSILRALEITLGPPRQPKIISPF